MTRLTMRTIDVNGLTTRLYEGGDTSRETVVFLHDGSYGSDALLAFGSVAERLTDEYHVVAPDLLGWGGSAKVHHFDESLYAPRIQHLAALLRALEVESAHFVGNSFGGSLILRAGTGLAGGLPLRSAVSIAGTGGPWRSAFGLSAMQGYAATPEDARRVSDFLVTEERASDEHVNSRLANSLIPGHWESLTAWGLRNPQLSAAPPADDFPRPLAEATFPILLVECRDDVMVESGWSEKFVAEVPHARRLVIDTGHSPNIEQPEVVVDILREFYGDL